MSGTLLKVVMLSLFVFAGPIFAQDTKPTPAETKPAPKLPTDNSAFALVAAAKSAQMVAAMYVVKGSKDGEPTAQLFHVFGDAGDVTEYWLITQKVKDTEAPIGRKLVHLIVYVDSKTMGPDGKELEKPEVKVRAIRLAEVAIDN
jgi:hypothetical protein